MKAIDEDADVSPVRLIVTLLVSGIALGSVMSGCGSPSSAAGGAECLPTPVSGQSGSRLVDMPPAPVITRATRDTGHIYVDLLLPRTGATCKPVTVLVMASSRAEGSNQTWPRGAVSGRGDGRELAYRAGPLHVVMPRPILDLPPYTVFASASGARGERSPIARYPIAEKGDYCLRHRPTDRCIREAQALAKRCGRAEAPRTRCADWAYGASRPYPATPVTGATMGAVRENLRAVLRSQLYNGVRLANLTCTPALTCFATYEREGGMRVRYVLSGYHQKPGCWFATTIDVIDPPELSPPSSLQAGVPLNNQAWCLSWRTPEPRD